ncbi:MAG: response regulator, partial [Anaerolineales bacterium]|nr:response regulator [Anaerolineales bacterium]
ILDFSKIEAGKMELENQPFDLRDCVEGTLDLVAGKAFDKGLDLAYLIDEQTPSTFSGDMTRLRQILLNLFTNAVKFTETGEVVLTIKSHPISNAGRKVLNSDIHELHFAVRDTGIGIPKERMDRLFQSFSQVDASTTRKYGGTGLGLAISRRLSEMMGGSMWAESQEGVGTTFYFTIHTKVVDQPVVARPDLQGDQPQLADRKVLIVDDNETNRRILRLHVEKWGMVAGESATPGKALEWIRKGEKFDVAILDMHMPGMGGVMLATELRQHPAGHELPLVLFTSLWRREVHLQGVEFAAHLTKPIKPSQLFDALVSIFSEKPLQVRREATSKAQLDPDLAISLPLRILLTEDNVVNQKLALRLLQKMGYRADVAGNGIEAIQALERQPYDVILMDVQMPEMDGLEATRQINQRWERHERPHIIAMTANVMPGDREMCLAAGMDDYIAKPLRVEEIVDALKRAT